MGFRDSFIPLAGCFSPFPHGTRSLSVAREYLALEGGPPCFPQDFPCPVVLRLHSSLPDSPVRYGALTLLRRRFPATSRNREPVYLEKRPIPGDAVRLQPRRVLLPAPGRFGLVPFRSPLLRESRRQSYDQRVLISSPHGTEMFQFPRFPPPRLPCFSGGPRRLTAERLPHSGSDGSSLACSSPSTFRRSPRPSSAPGP